MSKVTMDQCDGCKKVVENSYNERGWVSFAGTGRVSITRSTGVFGSSSYETDYLSGVTDFCSLDCLVKALDRAALARESKKNPNSCIICHKSCDPMIVCEGKKYHKHCHDSVVCGPTQKHP